MEIHEQHMRVYLGSKEGDLFLQKVGKKRRVIIQKLINKEKRKLGSSESATSNSDKAVSN